MVFRAQRQEEILQELAARGSVRISVLTERFGVSQMTLRRDLQQLAERDLLKRVHGGAVSSTVSGATEVAMARAGRIGRHVATIGMVAPSATYYYPEVIRGATERARELGCRLVLAVSNYSAADEARQIERLLAKRVDGLLVTPSEPLKAGSSTHAALIAAKTPIVVVERSIDEDLTCAHLDSVRSDHSLGAQLAFQHLISLGHTRIGLAVRDVATAQSVRSGRALASQQLGMDPESFIVEIGGNGADNAEMQTDLSRLLQRCVETNTSAVLVLTDHEAMSLVELASERGIRVPDDLAVVAYDDEIAGLASVPLTAVAPAKRELGRLAMALCFERITAGSGSFPAAPRRVNLLPELHVRGSTITA